MAPVGIVTVVSMNTIWNRNSVNTPTSYDVAAQEEARSCRSRPNGLPEQGERELVVQRRRAAESAPTAPTPPICSAKPQIQYPSMPIG